MTEQEAKEILTLSDDMKKELPNLKDVYEVAVNALEEIQQYRSLGTLEEFKNCKNILNKSETEELAKIIDEWLLYHKIGTLEELREAREKQVPYKPKEYQMYCGKCKCGAVFLDKSTRHCGNCGQAILWE